MASIFETSTYEAKTADIVHDVFDAMLLYDIQESSEDYSTHTNVVTAALFLAGTWKGAVILECSESQACFFTERLMGIPQPTQIDDDTRDAMGELVNMIGGNLKSVLPPGVTVSMPSVLQGADYAYSICGSNQNMRLSFRGDAGPLWVTLVQIAEPSEKTHFHGRSGSTFRPHVA